MTPNKIDQIATLSLPGDELQRAFAAIDPDLTRTFRLVALDDRQAAAALAFQVGSQLSFVPRRCREAAIVISELAENMVLHAGGGKVAVSGSLALGILEVLATDDGPGIKDLALACQDGHTDVSAILPEQLFRRGGTGCGLGAVLRLSNEVHLTTSQRGTTVRVYFVG